MKYSLRGSLKTVALCTVLFCMSATAFADQKVNQTQQKQQQQERLSLQDVQRFTNAIAQIKSFYVEPVQDEELFKNAIKGMLEGLDPHSTYLDPQAYQELTSITQGEFGGLGIEVTMEDGFIKVISPIEGTPAEKAGIKTGDIIVRLNETPVKGMGLSDALKVMRGPKGTAIDLWIVRKGENKPLKFHLVREIIQIHSVRSKMLEPGYGYVKLSQFQVNSAEDVNKAVAQLEKQSGGHLKGLLLDLRNNPGGLLDSAVDVSDLFLDSNKLSKSPMIVFTKTRIPGGNFNAKAQPGDILHGAPMVVLINEGSASGAEIVAGALQDHKRAILLGTKTFGKGSVQTVIPLDRTSAIKLTTALYYTPNGRSIQAKGITPDINVDMIKIAKPTDEQGDFAAITEANLLNHLDALNPNAAKDAKNDANLQYDDYQLYQGLNLLKGMVIAEKNQSSLSSKEQ